MIRNQVMSRRHPPPSIPKFDRGRPPGRIGPPPLRPWPPGHRQGPPPCCFDDLYRIPYDKDPMSGWRDKGRDYYFLAPFYREPPPAYPDIRRPYKLRETSPRRVVLMDRQSRPTVRPQPHHRVPLRERCTCRSPRCCNEQNVCSRSRSLEDLRRCREKEWEREKRRGWGKENERRSMDNLLEDPRRRVSIIVIYYIAILKCFYQNIRDKLSSPRSFISNESRNAKDR